MQGRYPTHVVLIAEHLAGSIDTVDPWLDGISHARTPQRGDFGPFNYYCNRLAEGGKKQPFLLTVLEVGVDDGIDHVSIQRPEPSHPSLEVVSWGLFEKIAGTLPSAPVGNVRGLLLGLTDCAEPDRLDAFHQWYDTVHAADVVRSPWYASAQRFRRLRGDLPEYLALYESEGPEPDSFESYLAWPDRNPEMSDAAAVRHVWTFNRLEGNS